MGQKKIYRMKKEETEDQKMQNVVYMTQMVPWKGVNYLNSRRGEGENRQKQYLKR